MVDLKQLRHGTKVKIVDEWPNEYYYEVNHEGKMDKWQGKTMTVEEVSKYCAFMQEDCHEHRFSDNGPFGWAWFPELMDCIVKE